MINAVPSPISYNEQTPKSLGLICGQFVDRILSTQPITNGKEWERMPKRSKSSVAATFEKANTYVFAALIIRDREVGGSNPLAPTNYIKHLRLPSEVAVLVLWQDCGRAALLPPQLSSLCQSRVYSVA